MLPNHDRRSAPVMKWLLAILCLPVGAFCVFGFLATFEPGAANAMAFRVVYAVVLVGCVTAVLNAVCGVFRKKSDPQT
jgi:hypothetical protein